MANTHTHTHKKTINSLRMVFACRIREMWMHTNKLNKRMCQLFNSFIQHASHIRLIFRAFTFVWRCCGRWMVWCVLSLFDRLKSIKQSQRINRANICFFLSLCHRLQHIGLLRHIILRKSQWKQNDVPHKVNSHEIFQKALTSNIQILLLFQ